jgi:predicted CXXCH cytochrome family protein
VAGRTRTAKSLARRIDLDYFKRSNAFGRWTLVLSMAIPSLVLLWLAGMAAAGSNAPYSSGPVSAAHQVFGERCERCHVTQARTFRAHVTDNMCMSCHDAPAHKTNQTFAPTCASCHLEHRGAIRLAATANRDCEQCHLDLGTTTGRVTIAGTVGSFNDGHPEFAATRQGSRDVAVLKFNHEVHMKPDLRGPTGATRLECATCHRPGLAAAAVTPPAGPRSGRPRDAMAPVSYAGHCASCHPLYFDPLIEAMAPHETPDKVRAVALQALSDFIAKNPDQIGKPDPARGRIPVNFPEPMPPVRTAQEWLQVRTTNVERLLWSKTCAECHTVEGQAPLPRIVPTNVPAGWMPRARFEHAAHQMASCTSCHAAQTSRETADVLMPSIATCQQCHKPTRGAESRCFECHEYHDWAAAKPVRPGFSLDQLF